MNMNSDPFTSNYPVNGNSFTATHFAKLADIDEDNAKLLFLSANSRGVVDTSKDALREVFTKRGYTCRNTGEGEDETEEDENANAVEDTEDTEETTGEDEETYEPDDEDYDEESTDYEEDYDDDSY